MSDTLVENLFLRGREESGEASWLLERRREAWADAQTLELPRLEKTRIDRLGLEKALPGPGTSSLAAEARTSGEAAGTVVTLNGRRETATLDPELERKGVVFASLEDALARTGDTLKPYLLSRTDRERHLLAALHRTYMNGGTVLFVPRGVEIALPLEAMSLVGGSDAYPHTLLVLGPMARVTVVETFATADDAPITVNAAMEAHLGPGAFLRYAGVQKLSKASKLYLPRTAYLDREARVEWIVVQAGGGRVVTTNETVMEGEGSSAQSYAVFLGDGDQILDFQTRMYHDASHTASDMDTKGVMKDRAKAAYTGFTSIRKGARGCESWQTEKTLMLSPDCRADLIPALWIDDDDVVRAGHSAAAGQVSREQLYYLMSRGIPEDEALLLLVSGFLDTIIQHIPLENVRDEIRGLAAEKVRG